MIYTSRYSNPELKSGEYTPVRISLGAPRWRIGYTIAGAIKELMPSGLRNISDVNEFCRLYYQKLDSVGVDLIGEQLKYYESFGKPVVLLCFEDIRKGGDNWCHRIAFAKWWKSRAGTLIPELKDDSDFITEGLPVVLPDVEIPKIRIVLTKDSVSRIYKDQDGRETEISFEDARKLLIANKAKIKDIEIK